MKKLTVILLILAAAGIASAQVLPGHHTYRVTAYKQENNNIYSVSNYAEVFAPSVIFIPSAFTPNSDGMNDKFRIKGENLQDFKLLVYDRWGEKIYESENPGEGWDGTFHGNPVQNDVYVYQVTASNISGKKLTGSVTLVR